MSDTETRATPPLAEFLDAFAEDDNEWWRLQGGDHLNLFEELLDERDAARAEVAALRSAVEQTADTIEGDSGVAHNYGCEGEPDCLACIVAELRALLASVRSSGEAESGEACGAVHPTLDLVLPCQQLGRHHALHRSTTTYGAVVWWDADRPAPVPSGGQADGEGEAMRRATDYARAVLDECEDDLDAEVAGALARGFRDGYLAAARPVLSREALRTLLEEHWLSEHSHHTQWRDHLGLLPTVPARPEARDATGRMRSGTYRKEQA